MLSPVFCRHCGNRLDGTPFCTHCGTQVRLAVPTTPPLAGGSRGESAVSNGDPRQTPNNSFGGDFGPTWESHAAGGASGQPTQAEQQLPPYINSGTVRSRRAIQIGAAATAFVVVIGAAVLAFSLLGRSKHAPSYPTQASQLVSPVVADNAKIASVVQALAPGGNAQAAQAAVAAAQDATQVAQQSLALLKPSRSQAALAGQIDAALTSEATWLQTASSVLDNPSSPLLSQLSGLGVDAGTKLQQMDSALSVGDGANFPSSNQIVVYASAANAAAAARSQAAAVRAQTTAAETQFSNQVLALLNQSASSFQSVNSFYQQLEAAAQGNGATITLAQAEQQISTIVANRSSLAAAAQAVNAPTPAASTVRDDLVAAFNASLQNDNDLDTCLNQANDGTDAYIFQGCLNASSTDSDAASAAKQTFLGAYNQLRARIGQSPVSMQF